YMIGDGLLKNDILKIINESEFKERVKVFSSDNVASIFKKSKIYVGVVTPDNVPSQAALEALEFGNIIVVSNTGRSKVFVSNKNGFLVDLNEKALADGMVKAIEVASNGDL